MAVWSEDDGILLYYKYVSIPDVSALHHFYESNCTSLALLGRVRIAPHGVNVTVCCSLLLLFLPLPFNHLSSKKKDSLFVL